MQYQINKGSKAFGPQEIFNDIQFELKEGEKAALVGRNGSGKTTLLKIISSELDLDSGEIHRPRDLTVGVLAQTSFADEAKTVHEELIVLYQPVIDQQTKLDDLTRRMISDHSEEILDDYARAQHEFEAMNGYTWKQEMMTVVTKFGFAEEDLKRPISTFSGGQKTKLAFVKLLLSKPDILLLDEPTNHLDMATIEWLETYLRYYEKAVIFVSHDRMFIDHVAEVVWELEFGALTRYSGNYAAYTQQKTLNQEKQLTAFKRQQKDIKRLEELIEKFRYKKSKAAFAQSKIKYLDRMDKISNPKSDRKNFKTKFHARLRGGKTVYTCKDLVIGYDRPLASVNLEILSGQRIAVIGPNGHGKSTFLKTVMGLIPPLSGDQLIGHQIETGYFDQDVATFTSGKSLLEELWDSYPDLTHTQVRTILGSFLFTADEVFKTVDVISGGEKVRLSLAKLMLEQANFMILDEPTNHLDLLGREALEEAFSEYHGTILFVSHDRYFIQKMATGVLHIESGEANYFPLKFEEFSEIPKEVPPETIAREVKQTKQNQVKDLKKELAKLEKSISIKEDELEELREKRFDPHYYHDYKNMQLLDDQIDSVHNEIASFMQVWEALSEELDKVGKNVGNSI
jgi:ATP-binding cassette subfamily F protein 3